MADRKHSSRIDSGRVAKDGCLTPALDRGLQVLELLARQHVPLRAIDMVQELGIPKGSLGRILKNLLDRGYIERDEITMTHALTSKLLAMGSSTVSEGHLIEESMDVIRDLRDLTTEMVMLHAPLSSSEGVVLNSMPSRHQVRLVVDPGTHFEYHNTAPGKVLLAFSAEKDRGRIVSCLKLTGTTDRTITDMVELRGELDEARGRGYALDRGECVEGVQCVSAPVYERNRTLVAALTVSGPSTRLTISKLKELAPVVLAHAAEISRRLGYEGARD